MLLLLLLLRQEDWSIQRQTMNSDESERIRIMLLVVARGDPLDTSMIPPTRPTMNRPTLPATCPVPRVQVEDRFTPLQAVAVVDL